MAASPDRETNLVIPLYFDHADANCIPAIAPCEVIADARFPHEEDSEILALTSLLPEPPGVTTFPTIAQWRP
jgi:hypothetical protein